MQEMTKEDISTVVAIDGKKVTLEVCPTEGCSSCNMSGACGMGNKNKYFTLETDLPLKIGDKVTLQIQGGSEVVSSLVLFLLPIIFMILGFVLGRFVFAFKESTSVLFSILGLGLSFFVVKIIDHYYGKKISINIIPTDGILKEEENNEDTTA